MSVSDIYNFIDIDGRIATAGQPTADQFRAARDAGYEAVINLAPDGLDTSLAGERELVEELGLEYHHLPVAWKEVGLDHLRAFARLMAEVEGKRTLIHCQANYRVTAFFGLHAEASRGWSRERADALMSRIWNSNPGYTMDETWKAFIAEARAAMPA